MKGQTMYVNLLWFVSQMGTADAILDLVSSGTTLRENNLKEISGGLVLESQVRFIFPRKIFNDMLIMH